MELGPYELLDELGRGGMGVVYRARHRSLGHEVALKVIRSDQGVDDHWRARFRREARAASQLAAHPHIVGAHDAGETDGDLWYAMELVRGTPLDSLIAGGDLGPEQAAMWIEQAARGVHHAHDHGLLHRDLKPANILVAGDGTTAQVADFGLAGVQQADPEVTRLTKSAEIVGTPDYMPPEQAMGQGCDGTADVYGLGATLYHAVAGRPPFDGSAPRSSRSRMNSRSISRLSRRV